MKIIIYSPPYDPSSGGIIVLHKLCDILIDLGYNAGFYINTDQEFYVNSSYKYNIFHQSDISLNSDVVIYPEIVWGNPLGIKNVVRYIMNIGHITLGRKNTWGEDDFWIYYSEHFYDKIKPKNILTISDSKLEYYKNYNIDRIHKECFTYRKSADRDNNIIHSKNAIEIPLHSSDEYLINIFNTCERFYCYDTKSHLTVLASLCGCDAIIVPNGESRKEVIEKSAKQHYGVAYGVNEVKQARKTRNKLRSFLEQEEINQISNTKNMFKYLLTFFTNK